MNALLILAFAVVFVLVHLANGWVFQTIEISAHVGLVYLPAFLRLFNVLILGSVKGSLATLLGGFLLMRHFDEAFLIGGLNILSSVSGPLIALFLFQIHFQRHVELTSLRDLLFLAIISCLSNTLMHHLIWSAFDPANLVTSYQVVWMALGDFMGCLIGVGLMKWGIERWGLLSSKT